MSMAYRNYINKYIELQPHDLSRVEKDGERDGKIDIPESSETEPSGAILKILTEARGAWDRYISEKKIHLDELKKNLASTEYNIDTNIQTEISKEQDKLNDDQNVLINQEGIQSTKYEQLSENLTSAKHDYDMLRSELNRPLLTKFEKLYLPFLLILSVAEIPVNLKAFALFFDGKQYVLLALAIAVGTMLIFFSHTVGHLIRELGGNDVTKELKLKKYFGIGAISSVITILVYVLALMRQKLADLDSVGGTDSLSELIKTTGPVETFQDALFTPLGTEGFILLVLNLTIIAAGVIASFFRHDPHPYYEKVTKSYNDLRDKTFEMKKKQGDQLSDLQEKYNRKLEIIRNKEQNLNKDKAMILEEIKSIEAFDKDDLKNIINSVDRLILSYQSGNSKFRNTNQPVFFKKSYSKEIREFLGQ
jgi:hypothetical protein